MSKKRLKRHKVEQTRQAPSVRREEPRLEINDEEQLRRERYCEIGFILLLFAFGVYQSILYFGHTVVPISDFPDLYDVGRKILSFKLPVRFKQAPVLGMLQVACSYIVGGDDPNLKAGWLLNALLHPFNLVLLYLVGKRIIGKAALWVAVAAILNPWVVYLLTEPIVETTYLFFILLTFYFMFRRSKWCYLFASVTTMVRYEGAALILAAFVFDMIDSTDNRQRVRAVLYSVAASIPLGLWMLGTILKWEPGSSHYLNVFSNSYKKESFGQSGGGRTGLLLHLRLLWHVGFRPLLASVKDVQFTFGFTERTAAGQQAIESFYVPGKIIAAGVGGFGAIYGLLKRNWRILALLIFFVPYFILHAFYPYPLQRFHVTIFWIALLLFCFGLQGIWRLIDGEGRVPRAIVLGLQVLAGVIAVIWLIILFPYLSKVSSLSPESSSVPYVAIGLVVVFFAARTYLFKVRVLGREFAIVSLAVLVIVSNQFRLVPLVNDGQKEAEFKELADWYSANVKGAEKMGLYMSPVVSMFAPSYADQIVRLPGAETPEEFIQACYEKDITYVVWATREGLGQQHAGYKQLKLDKNIAALRSGRSVGPYEFVARVSAKRGYVNVYRLRRPVGRESEGS